MNNIDPKELFFKYSCLLPGIYRDTSLRPNDDIIKKIIENQEKWTEEYHELILNKIKESIIPNDILQLVVKYELSSFGYNDIYKLAIVLTNVILEKKIIDKHLFIQFYCLFIDKNTNHINRDFYVEENLFIYLKNDNMINPIINDLNKIIYLDKNESHYKDTIKKLIETI